MLKILILNFKLKEPLDNPVAASVFPTFTMATMLLAGYGATCCRVMTRQWAGDNFMSPERKAHCIEITGVVAEWVAKALIDDGKLAVPEK